MRNKFVLKLLEYLDLICHIRSIKPIFSDGGYLFETGWKKCQWDKKKAVTDNKGNSIPWLTYSFLDFIEPRLTKEMCVFEYGCGYSSVWWADRCKSVTSVESSEQWWSLVKSKVRNDNLTLIYENGKEDFCSAPAGRGHKYHIIIVDQADDMDRNMAMKLSVDYLTKDGVLILDDSEREKYLEGTKYLLNQGFRRIDFTGLASTVSYSGKTTTVFYKDDNVLNI